MNKDKRCLKCFKTKDVEEFSLMKTKRFSLKDVDPTYYRLHPWCISCDKEYQKAYQKAYREKKKALNQECTTCSV